MILDLAQKFDQRRTYAKIVILVFQGIDLTQERCESIEFLP